jgi:hypothetical protein
LRGFHPLAAWRANTGKSLAMVLWPGNAGANTVAGNIAVLGDFPVGRMVRR